jgi:hypothetical protein
MRVHELRIAVLILTAAFAGAGCASDDPKQEKPAAPAANKPADPPPKKPANTAPAAETPQDQSAGPIVIKGSKRHDSADASTTSEDPERAAKIEALKQKAAASQGQDNGQALKGDLPPDATAKPKLRSKDAVRTEVAAIDAKIASLESQRKDLVSVEHTRRGPKEVAGDNQDQVTAIDAQLNDLRKQKADDLAELAAIEAAPKKDAK